MIRRADSYVVGNLIDDPEIRTLNKTIIAWIAGALVMVAGFFVVQGFMYVVGAAMAEAPFNFVQMAVAGIVGIPSRSR